MRFLRKTDRVLSAHVTATDEYFLGLLAKLKTAMSASCELAFEIARARIDFIRRFADLGPRDWMFLTYDVSDRWVFRPDRILQVLPRAGEGYWVGIRDHELELLASWKVGGSPDDALASPPSELWMAYGLVARDSPRLPTRQELETLMSELDVTQSRRDVAGGAGMAPPASEVPRSADCRPR